jgi:hypothetical protein
MLQVFHLDVAKVDLDVAYVEGLYTHVSSVYFKCFIVSTYVANISSGCFRSRSERAHVSFAVAALLLLLGASPWVTMRAHEADRHLHSMHSQAG